MFPFIHKFSKKLFFLFLLFFLKYFLFFSQNINFGYDFENMLNINKRGSIYKNNFSFDLNNEIKTLGMNIDTGNLISTVDDVPFTSIYFNDYFFISIHKFKFYSDLLFFNFDELNI